MKGECNLGQHEIAFRYSDLVDKADEHSLFKLGAKEIAAQEGCSLTFMAKFDEREGNSCHVHLSLRDEGEDRRVRRGPGARVLRDLRALPRGARRVLAGVLAAPRAERQQLQALRPRARSRRPRSCGASTTGRAPSASSATARRSASSRGFPAVTSTPTSRSPRMVAAGLRGVDEALPLAPGVRGQRVRRGRVARCRPPSSEAAALFEQSDVARAAFGDEVVDHYVHAARVELAAFGSAVTDWERIRGFERL